MDYKLQIASDVIRDGIAVELIDETNNVVAEVFRWDFDNRLTFSSFVEDLPFVEIEKLIAISRNELQQFEDGTELPNRKT